MALVIPMGPAAVVLAAPVSGAAVQVMPVGRAVVMDMVGVMVVMAGDADTPGTVHMPDQGMVLWLLWLSLPLLRT